MTSALEAKYDLAITEDDEKTIIKTNKNFINLPSIKRTIASNI